MYPLMRTMCVTKYRHLSDGLRVLLLAQSDREQIYMAYSKVLLRLHVRVAPLKRQEDRRSTCDQDTK